MKAFIKMTWIELKLYMREPVGVFFTMAFPLLLLFLFGSIYGNEPSPFFNGLGSVDNSIPGYIGMIIGTIGMVGLPITLSNYRQQGILRRFRASPLQPGTILWAQVVVNVVVALLGVGLLAVAARLAYKLILPAAPLAVILAIVLGGLSFLALGFVLAGLLPSPRTAQAVGMALFYPMLFLSGAAIPRQVMPDGLQRIANYLPLTHVVKLIEGLWFKGNWNLLSLGVVVGLLAVCLLISQRTFRWE